MHAPVDPIPGLSPTLEARVAELLAGAEVSALAETMVEHPGATIRPGDVRSASSRGLGALEALRSVGASLHGKIEIHRTLGEGGMGIVRLATQATVGRHVAVKTLRDAGGGADASLRILREAWVTGALEHPNVVPVYDVGVDAAGSPVIVMKRIEGQNWRELLRSPGDLARRFPGRDALDGCLEVLGDVCNAVHFAHSRGILHRDLKPENVMIGSFGEVYVLDWGIAVSLHDDPTGRLPLAATATEIAGTPSYMAPEMLLGDASRLSPATDVYLLGAILYELFAGHPPHEGADLNALVNHILVSPIHFPDSVPEEVRAISRKAMSRDPAARYQSAEAFRRAIDEYVRHRGSRRLEAEARQSHALLREALAAEGSDARAHDVARLVGECRFGYRAALSAWPENAEAREGLDGALLAVVAYSLEAADAGAAESLLREVTSRPPELVERVQAALADRDAEKARFRELAADLDVTTGTRTRTLLGAVFGGLWTASPLLLWAHTTTHDVESPAVAIVGPLVFLLLGVAAYRWARETLTKTSLNRRLMGTGAVYFSAQSVLATGGWLAGLAPHQVHLLTMFGWSLTFGLLSIWAESWFAVVAVTSGVTFLLSARFPALIYALMSLGNFVFTVVLVRVWLPKDELRRLHERARQAFHERE